MSIIILSRCPICGSENIHEALKTTDYFSSGEVFPLYDCLDCGFRFTNSFPSEDIIGRYYDSPNYISHSDSHEGLVNRLYHIVRKRMLQKKADIVSHYAPGRQLRLLDYGCGTGHFLKTAIKRGWSAAGIEKNPSARKYAAGLTGTGIMDENGFQKIEDASFDVITLWHVLEHVENLNETIEEINRILTPEGAIIIALPNFHSYDARFYDKQWAAYDLPRHLWHFTPISVRELMNKHRLNVVKMLKMPMDAYYISLISEKYKISNPITRYFRALYIGTAGLFYSLFNLEQSSSIIYIIKKTD